MKTFQLAAVLLLFGLPVVQPLAANERMNVIFILADDLGYSDTTLYGTTDFYQTPNIERLAKRGMTFNRAYSNSPLCSPTRTSIMTGQTPARHGATRAEHSKKDVYLKATVLESAKPSSKVLELQAVNRLDTTFPTLGKMIKAGGYATGHFGKWHLGHEPYTPLEHGFDVDIPHTALPGPLGGFLAPWKFARDLHPQAPGEHIEDRMAKEAINWMNALSKDQPFFMNYWQFSVHAPFQAKPQLIEKYKKLVDPDSRQKSPTYAAMVETCDDAVGRLLDAVDAAGIADRTIIIFTSDNGGNVHQKIPADGAYVTSNFPLKGGKSTISEGGVHVPCVVVWPGVTEPGSRSDEIIQTSDFYTTLLENLGMGMPDNHEVDGIDIMPALKGGELDRDGIFSYFPRGTPAPGWLPPSMSVHAGDWKLIRIFHGGENGAHDYRLYNLSTDIGEELNLAESFPKRVQQLDRLIEGHIQDANAVVPLPDPDFDPEQYHPERIGLPPDQWNVRANADKKPSNLPVTPMAKSDTKPGTPEVPGKVAEGWGTARSCKLTVRDGKLVVESTGKSNFSATKFEAIQGGPFTLQLRVRSNASGKSTILFNKPSRETLVPIPLVPDGSDQELSVKLTTPTLKALRFNPTRVAGTVEYDWVRILDATGKVVRAWQFDDGPPALTAPAKSMQQERRQQSQKRASPAPNTGIDQSQDFKIDILADNTNQWTGKRNTIWNSWRSHPVAGHQFLRDPDRWMAQRWNPGEAKNVRIMGGMMDGNHHWMLGVKDGEPVCDFTDLIKILQAELDHGLTPGIVLDEVPWELAVRIAPGPPSAKTMKYWNNNYGNDGPPRDYDLWNKYVKQFLHACIDAFGHEEVSSWQFRVTTEPDNDRHWGGTWEEYIIHYDHTVQAVTEVIPNAWIGPGNFIAMWLTDGNEHQLGTVESFVKHCVEGNNHATGETGTRMTFLAFSAYTMSTAQGMGKQTFDPDIAFRKARAILDEHPQLNKYLDNDAMPGWFAIEVHEYGDLAGLAGNEWLWGTEWMAGFHAYMMDLSYNSYGVYKPSFWFQTHQYDQMYPYVRVSQMLAEFEGGTLVEVKKHTASESTKVKYGAISAWKDGSLYVLIYNFNWDPLHQGTLRGQRDHTIDNTITLNITGKNIAAHKRWTLDHKIINEQSGNGSWYYDLKKELDAHPDLQAEEGNYYVRIPKQHWKGPVQDIMLSEGAYADNGVYERIKKLSQIGIAGKGIPVETSGGTITYTGQRFTQTGIQLLKFTPAP